MQQYLQASQSLQRLFIIQPQLPCALTLLLMSSISSRFRHDFCLSFSSFQGPLQIYILLLLDCAQNEVQNYIHKNNEYRMQNSRLRRELAKQNQKKFNHPEKNQPKANSDHVKLLNKVQVQLSSEKCDHKKRNQYDKEYNDMVQLCGQYRHENSELKNTIINLQNKIKALEQQNLTLSSDGGNPMTLYYNRIKTIQQQYAQFQRNLYESTKKQNKELFKTVEYLIICYQQYISSRNYKFSDFVAKVKEKGMGKVLSDQKFIEQMIGIYEGISGANNPDFCYNGAFGLGEQLDQKQSKILRQKIRQLSDFISHLIKLYRDNLVKLNQEAKGQSQSIVQQIKNCIVRNINKITECRPRIGKQNNNSASLLSQTTSINSSKQKNPKIKSREKKSVGQQPFSKKSSLGNSLQICNPCRPPLPAGQLQKTKNRSTCLNFQQIRINDILNPTPKGRRSVDGNKISKVLSLSKSKKNRN